MVPFWFQSHHISDIKHLFIDWDKNVIIFYNNIIKLYYSLCPFKYIGPSWALLLYKPITVLIVITFVLLIILFTFNTLANVTCMYCILWIRNNCLILWSILYWYLVYFSLCSIFMVIVWSGFLATLLLLL